MKPYFFFYQQSNRENTAGLYELLSEKNNEQQKKKCDPKDLYIKYYICRVYKEKSTFKKYSRNWLCLWAIAVRGANDELSRNHFQHQ